MDQQRPRILVCPSIPACFACHVDCRTSQAYSTFIDPRHLRLTTALGKECISYWNCHFTDHDHRTFLVWLGWSLTNQQLADGINRFAHRRRPTLAHSPFTHLESRPCSLGTSDQPHLA